MVGDDAPCLKMGGRHARHGHATGEDIATAWSCRSPCRGADAASRRVREARGSRARSQPTRDRRQPTGVRFPPRGARQGPADARRSRPWATDPRSSTSPRAPPGREDVPNTRRPTVRARRTASTGSTCSGDLPGTSLRPACAKAGGARSSSAVILERPQLVHNPRHFGGKRCSTSSARTYHERVRRTHLFRAVVLEISGGDLPGLRSCRRGRGIRSNPEVTPPEGAPAREIRDGSARPRRAGLFATTGAHGSPDDGKPSPGTTWSPSRRRRSGALVQGGDTPSGSCPRVRRPLPRVLKNDQHRLGGGDSTSPASAAGQYGTATSGSWACRRRQPRRVPASARSRWRAPSSARGGRRSAALEPPTPPGEIVRPDVVLRPRPRRTARQRAPGTARRDRPYSTREDRLRDGAAEDCQRQDPPHRAPEPGVGRPTRRARALVAPEARAAGARIRPRWPWA